MGWLWFSFTIASLLISEGDSNKANSEDYVLRPGDKIKVEVFKEPDLTRLRQIQADGIVQLALLRPLRVSGMPLSKAQNEIARHYVRRKVSLDKAILEGSKPDLELQNGVTLRVPFAIP